MKSRQNMCINAFYILVQKILSLQNGIKTVKVTEQKIAEACLETKLVAVHCHSLRHYSCTIHFPTFRVHEQEGDAELGADPHIMNNNKEEEEEEERRERREEEERKEMKERHGAGKLISPSTALVIGLLGGMVAYGMRGWQVTADV